ncbi:UNVERIFIED_CONTAM: Retrovirus-related Pol polyprotein from transposon gypsy [Sesamum latifolium]|uniref:Retrovirus-related Pol polyprotein from transposon gypsy n=1 Tax=Sesamum latifolium TaxID=2727402 RepID=A0AAW2XW85_9LAMI
MADPVERNKGVSIKCSTGRGDYVWKQGRGHGSRIEKHPDGDKDGYGYAVHKVLVDNGSSADIIFRDVLKKMDLDMMQLNPVHTPLVGFGGSEVISLGTIELLVLIGEEPKRQTKVVKFLVVDTPFAYNVILGRRGLNIFKAIVPTYHLKMKFPIGNGIGEVSCDQKEVRRCYNLSLKKGSPEEKKRKVGEESEIERLNDNKSNRMESIEPVEEHKSTELVPGEADITTRIGSQMAPGLETMKFLRKNVDMFAWNPSDFKGINPEVIVHTLNMDSMARPVKQKKRSFGAERNHIIEEEVNKLLEAGYVSEVNLNKACPKDPFPLPHIDLLVDSTVGCKLFTMMDAYQGYHQIFMAEEDRDKTYITENEIYCYNVMPFGLKNAGKFLGFMVSERGIEANPEKIEAIKNLVSPTVKEVHKLTAYYSSTRHSGHLIKWAVKFGEFDIEYQPRVAIKAQILADFVVEFSGEQKIEGREGWMLHVDGSSNANNGGGRILLQGPNGVEVKVAVRLSFPATNNEAEYETLILGLELAKEAGANDVEVYTDSQLVAMQDIKDRRITVMIKEKTAIDEIVEIQAIGNQGSWMDEIVKLLRDGLEPEDPVTAKRVRFKGNRFTLTGDQIYKRTVDGPLLKCLDNERAQYVMKEVHERSCENHSGGRLPAQKIAR